MEDFSPLYFTAVEPCLGLTRKTRLAGFGRPTKGLATFGETLATSTPTASLDRSQLSNSADPPSQQQQPSWSASDPIICKANGIGFPGPVERADVLAPSILASLVKCSCCYAVSQNLILGPLTQPRSIACAPLCKCTNVSITYIMIYAV
jgi:hypothetical protein